VRPLRFAVDFLSDVIQTALRLLPFPVKTGLIRVGQPDRQSPVLVTCNFGLSVRRVLRALRRLDAYLLVANSRGINVWCAASGGLLTSNDVISVVKTSGIGDLVEHRRLVLPQLSATGVERSVVEEKTGWRVVFGPVYAQDIPAYLANHYKKTEGMRTVRFNLFERLEMAVMWASPISVIPLIPLLIWWRHLALPFVAIVWGIALAAFVGFPWLPSWLVGVRSGQALPGWTKYLVVFDPRSQKILAVWAAAVAALVAYGLLVADWGWVTILGWILASLAVALLISLDLTGSTPLYKSGLHEDRLLTVALDADRCQGRAICLEVCPKDCFEVDSKAHKASIISENECVQCGACIVQCPEDALAFVDGSGRRIPPDEIRRYKLNLLGERSRAS
jgi:NAD-dependent dihydropyrimidine dehydrogenase PreA subunit